MLNVSEIRNLENRWKKYKRRRLYKYLGFTALLVLIFLVPIVFWNKSFIYIEHNKHSLEKKHLSKNKIPKKKEEKAFAFLKKEKNNTSEISLNKNIAKDDNFTKKTDNLNATQRKIDNPQNLENKVVKSIKNRSSLLTLDQSFLKHIYVEKRYLNQYEEASGNINKNYVLSTNYSDKNSEKSLENSLKMKKEDDINSKKPPKVFISAKKIDKISYFKRRYVETKKVLYAVLLAKEYYDKKKYDKSLKWAIEANNIDSNNIESWIYFAKSNVKLGRKEDAINALKAYLKFHTSKEVEALLKNIQSGIFK